jgi:hypothetical protein
MQLRRLCDEAPGGGCGTAVNSSDSLRPVRVSGRIGSGAGRRVPAARCGRLVGDGVDVILVVIAARPHQHEAALIDNFPLSSPDSRERRRCVPFWGPLVTSAPDSWKPTI